MYEDVNRFWSADGPYRYIYIAARDPNQPCPHPYCKGITKSVRDFRYHLRNIHRLWTARWADECCKGPKPEDSDDSDSLASTVQPRSYQRRAQKSSKREDSQLGGELRVIHWSLPSSVKSLESPKSPNAIKTTPGADLA